MLVIAIWSGVSIAVALLVAIVSVVDSRRFMRSLSPKAQRLLSARARPAAPLAEPLPRATAGGE